MNVARLSSRLGTLAVLLALALGVVASPLAPAAQSAELVAFCLGFILLFGYYLARVLEGVHLPAITSYILVGVACGPYGLRILDAGVIASLDRLDNVALSVIALIAGGELRLAVLRARARTFAGIIAGQVVLSFAGALLVVALLRGTFAQLEGAAWTEVVAVGLLFGTVVVARSPATTIGVIAEMRAAGPVTEVLVGVTVLLDVVVLVLAAVIVPAAETLVSGAAFDAAFVRMLAVEIVGSLAAGLVFGATLRSYIRWVGGYLPLFLLGLGLVGSEVCRAFHLEPLLAFMIAGFFVENWSEHGDRLIHGLERSAFPVYVLFFAVSGASIDLAALRHSWLVALVLVVVRAAAFWGGSVPAARRVEALRPSAGWIWSGYLAQAGVTIGIASLIARRFPWGAAIETIVLAVVAINQLVGPVALRLLLERSGEAGARPDAAT